jgi:type II secretory pathway component PulF
MRQALVIAISLVAFVIPNVVGFGVWYLGTGLPTIVRSLVAILGWVVSFGLSSLLFWRIVQVTFGDSLVR